ncbi:MAG: PQQ-dependent sugar dehydrogenase [Thermoleophilia bacterium]
MIPRWRRRLQTGAAAIAVVASLLLALPLLSCGGGTTSTDNTGATFAIGAATQTNPSSTGTHDVTIDGHTLTLPTGFTISRWVTGQGSLRMMAVIDDGLLLATAIGEGNVLAFNLAEANPQPVMVIKGLSVPSGITLHNGYLYVAEQKQVSRYQYLGGGKVGAAQVIIPGLPTGGHDTRTIGVGPDGMLYLTIGSSCNVCLETDTRRAAMSRYNLDGTGGEAIASGLRNTAGFTWNPVTGEIWGTDNGRDNLGDDLPPDEVNIITPGKNYGWPQCYGDRVVDHNFSSDPANVSKCAASEPPAVELQAHSAPLGLRFLTDPAWPAAWQNSLFIAFHGSWNRTVPTGYKVVRADPAGNVSDFITGWLDPASGQAWGRPVDIIFANNKMYISDDTSGSIYIVRQQ